MPFRIRLNRVVPYLHRIEIVVVIDMFEGLMRYGENASLAVVTFYGFVVDTIRVYIAERICAMLSGQVAETLTVEAILAVIFTIRPITPCVSLILRGHIDEGAERNAQGA